MRTSDSASYDIRSYIEEAQQVPWKEKEAEFESILKKINRYKAVNKSTKILEIGIGTGWIQVLCAKKKIPCTGLEISEDLISTARKHAAREGVSVDVKLGSIETFPLGEGTFDVVIASSTFEHVEDWRAGLANVYRSLRPGGVFYFISTNKFSVKSGEYDLPFYGWLPDKARYRLRVWMQGPEIMKWGIDFNAFTYFQLRRHFNALGYSKVCDVFDILDPGALDNPRAWKTTLLRTIKAVPPLKYTILPFVSSTFFICTK
jgi:ubiquinone/menaquinone biosynthesis C-methylase UbiE